MFFLLRYKLDQIRLLNLVHNLLYAGYKIFPTEKKMFRTKSLVVFAVVLLLAVASSAFALNVPELRQQMWTWSTLEAVIHESSPVISPTEAENCIAEARAKISKMVAEIKTPEEMAKGREVASEFISMNDYEEEVGHALNRMLDMQEKYLKAHREL